MKINEMIKGIVRCEKMDVIDMWTEEDRYHAGESIIVVKVELWEEERLRCPKCGEKCEKYDRPHDVIRWRGLDWGNSKFYIESINPRCKCPEHGVLKARVPWAFSDSNYTQAFEVRVAYAAAKAPINFVAKEYRVKWHTVGNCIRRVQENMLPIVNRFDNLQRIAIDETSYQKGYKYITTVQNLETGEIIWTHDGTGDAVLAKFFEPLTEEQRSNIKFVVADGARWITRQVEAFCPNAKRCVDPFHVVSWANDALDSVRIRLGNDMKKKDMPC